MQPRWLISFSGSCLYAARALERGKSPADKELAAALQQPAAALAREVDDCASSAGRLWSHLVPLSAELQNNRELAEVALTKAEGRQQAAVCRERLAGRIADLEAAFRQVRPHAVNDLELRAAPLREQWEARGPGLMAEIGRTTEPELLVAQADVVLVQPILGGGGQAHSLYNSVFFEAVLANPTPAVPEVLRLGWLLAQLNLDLPPYQGNFNRVWAARLGALALLPATLAAGEEVELCRSDEATVRTALEAWQWFTDVPVDSDTGKTLVPLGETAAVLLNWWDTYQSARPAWAVALAALDRMLG